MRKRQVLQAGAVMLAALSVAACGERQAGAAKLKKLDSGISTDSMFTILGAGPVTAEGNDSVRVLNGYRYSRFLSDGRMFSVVYVRDEPGTVADSLYRDLETPIVLVDDTVAVWGWKPYAKLGETYKFPVAPERSSHR
jgi:hypothetical protein